jgi:hypothetical protein
MADMYLHLFHGRKTPDEELDGWGTDGPEIGPLTFVHTTYADSLRIGFKDREANEKFFPNAQYPSPEDLNVLEDCLDYNGLYYGDWVVHLA